MQGCIYIHNMKDIFNHFSKAMPGVGAIASLSFFNAGLWYSRTPLLVGGIAIATYLLGYLTGSAIDDNKNQPASSAGPGAARRIGP